MTHFLSPTYTGIDLNVIKPNSFMVSSFSARVSSSDPAAATLCRIEFGMPFNAKLSPSMFSANIAEGSDLTFRILGVKFKKQIRAEIISPPIAKIRCLFGFLYFNLIECSDIIILMISSAFVQASIPYKKLLILISFFVCSCRFYHLIGIFDGRIIGVS